MTALARVCSRLINFRDRYAHNSVGRIVNGLFQSCPLSTSTERDAGHSNDSDSLITQKVSISKAFNRARFVGKEGKNISRLQQLCGHEFKIAVNGDHILVSGTDADGVKRSTEKVTQEVRRIEMLPLTKVNVKTHKDAYVHTRIVDHIKRSKLEIGVGFQVKNREVGYIVVSVRSNDVGEVQAVKELIKKEVERAKNTVAPITIKVLTDEDVVVHREICSRVIGREGRNIMQLESELGPNINLNLENLGHIVVGGTNAAEMERAIEKIKLQVQRAKNMVKNLTKGSVLTDHDADTHKQICRRIIGKRSHNIKQLISGLGSNIWIDTKKAGYIVVSGKKSEQVETAIEILETEVQSVKGAFVYQPFRENLLTDEDEDKHNWICGRVIGKRRENIKQLMSELGPNIFTNTQKIGCITVSGTNCEMMERAVEILKQEVQNIKDELVYHPFTANVVTDEDENIQDQICGRIIGKDGVNLSHLKSKLGPNIRVHMHSIPQTVGHIVVSAMDAEELKRGEEIVKQEVENIKKQFADLLFKGNVMTDQDQEKHFQICRRVIGKQGHRIKEMIPELGGKIWICAQTIGHVEISGENAEMVDKAVEILNQEVQRIRDEFIYKPITAYVPTDQDEDKHYQICGKIIGKDGENIKKLKSMMGPNVSVHMNNIPQTVGHIVISGTDDEEVKRAVEILKQTVQKFKHNFLELPFTENVLTDEDELKHMWICSKLIGNHGKNIKQLTAPYEPNIRVNMNTLPHMPAGHIAISGTDAEEVKNATEKIKHEVRAVQNEFLQFTEKVLTDSDAFKHVQICGYIIGKGGQNRKQIQSDLGCWVIARSFIVGHVVVCGGSAESLQKAVELVQLQVQKVKNSSKPFSEAVTTDEDDEIHAKICGRLIGRKGWNLKQMILNSGLDFEIYFPRFENTGCVYISAADEEVLTKAVEVVKQHIKVVRENIILQSYKSLFDDLNI